MNVARLRKEKGKPLNKIKTGSSRVILRANLRELFLERIFERLFPFPQPHRCCRCNAFVAILVRAKDTFTVLPFLRVTCVAIIALVPFRSCSPTPILRQRFRSTDGLVGDGQRIDTVMDCRRGRRLFTHHQTLRRHRVLRGRQVQV